MEVAKGMPQLTTLCGIKPDQIEANFSGHNLNAGDAILLAFDLKKNFVLVGLEYAAPTPLALPSAGADAMCASPIAASAGTASARRERNTSRRASRRTRPSRRLSARLSTDLPYLEVVSSP